MTRDEVKEKKSEYKEDGQPPLIVSEPIGYYYAPSFSRQKAKVCPIWIF